MPGKTLLAEPINPKRETPRRLAAVRAAVGGRGGRRRRNELINAANMLGCDTRALPSGRETSTSYLWRRQQGLWVI